MRTKNLVRGAWLLMPLLCACFDVPITGLCLSAVAHITSDSGGVGRLMAVAPGKLPPLLANGTSYPAVYSCDTRNVCAMVGEIDVVP